MKAVIQRVAKRDMNQAERSIMVALQSRTLPQNPISVILMSLYRCFTVAIDDGQEKAVTRKRSSMVQVQLLIGEARPTIGTGKRRPQGSEVSVYTAAWY